MPAFRPALGLSAVSQRGERAVSESSYRRSDGRLGSLFGPPRLLFWAEARLLPADRPIAGLSRMRIVLLFLAVCQSG